MRSPGRAAVLGTKGGRRRNIYNPDGLKQFATPKSAAELRDLLVESIIEIRAGKLDSENCQRARLSGRELSAGS